VVLVLDAGSALFPQWVALLSEGRVIVEGMNAMGYDAMAVGAMDGVKGLDVLLARRDEARFPFLSANLVYAGDGEHVVDPYTIIQRDGLTIGIIGLTDEGILRGPGMSDAVQVLDPVDTARQYAGELRERVDILIVLSYLGLEGDRAVPEAVPEVDIIVGGASSRLMTEPERVGDTLIVHQGYLGEWLGRLHVIYDGAGRIIEARAGYITLDDRFADDPDMEALVARYRLQYPTPTVAIPTRAATPRP